MVGWYYQTVNIVKVNIHCHHYLLALSVIMFEIVSLKEKQSVEKSMGDPDQSTYKISIPSNSTQNKNQTSPSPYTLHRIKCKNMNKPSAVTMPKT